MRILIFRFLSLFLLSIPQHLFFISTLIMYSCSLLIWYLKMCLSFMFWLISGNVVTILYMCTQIGIKAEWRAHHGRLVLFLGNKNTSPLVSVQAVILPPSHLKMELSLVPETIPPRAQVKHSYYNLLLSNQSCLQFWVCLLMTQVQCPLEVTNLNPSRDVAVLDFSYKFGNDMVLKFKLLVLYFPNLINQLYFFSLS